MENILAPIMSFKKLHVAVFVKEQLQHGGIDCFLTDEGFGVTEDHAPKGFRIKVSVNDTEKAVNILLRIQKEHDLENLKEDITIEGERKILVPVDIADYPDNLLEYAFGIAKETNAELKLLYVYKDPIEGAPVKHTTSWELHEKIEAAEAYNNAQIKMVQFRNEVNELIDQETRNKTKMHFAMLRGKPETVINAVCRRYKPSLVVMAPKERKGSFMSSVTTSVIEQGNIPVMTIPKSAKYKGLETINIMYATDFYDSDNTSLNTLLEIVSPFKTNIHCIHVDIDHDELKETKVIELNELLATEYKEYQIECKLIESSDLIKGFESFVKKNNIDLISFSSPKKTMFYKMFHPNILKKMVSHTKIPMLVFPIP
jgi:nucleotide-binding universal stress UspA family protein